MLEWLRKKIYPAKCMICQKLIEDETYLLCEACYEKQLKEYVCLKCGRPYQFSEGTCLFCKGNAPRGVEGIIAIFPYKELCRKSVLRWKYKGIRKYARYYAKLMVERLETIENLNIDGLIPVPLSKERSRRRGFNQALDLALEISKLTHIPVYDCLERTKNTKPQSKCSKEERASNIAKTMRIKQDILWPPLKQVAIIDDIYTTGSTISECIRAINKELQVVNEKVYVLVICIGV